MISEYLEVYLHKQKIGKITYIGNDRSIFAFDGDYLKNARRSTLSLSFKKSQGAIIDFLPATQTSLAPYFSNLLPEGGRKI